MKPLFTQLIGYIIDLPRYFRIVEPSGSVGLLQAPGLAIGNQAEIPCSSKGSICGGGLPERAQMSRLRKRHLTDQDQ